MTADRIRELERWHAKQDCTQYGHLIPDGHELDPDAVETVDIVAWIAPQPIRTLPARGEYECPRCGEGLPLRPSGA